MRWPEAALRRASLLLGTGYVLYFFSETLFWSQWRPDETLLDRLLSWLLYSLLGYGLLVLLRLFRVRDAWGLLIAGAGFGWVGEGVVAMTVFGDPSMPFPFTLSWTALAWHAPISVLVGWHLLGLALRAQEAGPAVILSCGLGAFWGVWAFGWRFDAPPVAATVLDFSVHAAASTAVLALAYVAVSAGRPGAFHPSRIGLWLAILVPLGFTGLITIPQVPLALVVLPVLAALTGFLLVRHRRAGGRSVLILHDPPLRPRNVALLALMPAMAGAAYAALGAAELPINTLPVVAVVGTLVGTALFLVAAARTLRTPRRHVP